MAMESAFDRMALMAPEILGRRESAMDKIIMVGVGGFIGAVLRYLVSGGVQAVSGIDFPYGTLVVNLLGCLLIGLTFEFDQWRAFFSPEMRMLVFTGIFGAFTTYSTFGNETWNLLYDGQTGLAFMNVGVHLVGGLLAVWLGHAAGALLWR